MVLLGHRPAPPVVVDVLVHDLTQSQTHHVALVDEVLTQSVATTCLVLRRPARVNCVRTTVAETSIRLTGKIDAITMSSPVHLQLGAGCILEALTQDAVPVLDVRAVEGVLGAVLRLEPGELLLLLRRRSHEQVLVGRAHAREVVLLAQLHNVRAVAADAPLHQGERQRALRVQLALDVADVVGLRQRAHAREILQDGLKCLDVGVTGIERELLRVAGVNNLRERGQDAVCARAERGCLEHADEQVDHTRVRRDLVGRVAADLQRVEGKRAQLAAAHGGLQHGAAGEDVRHVADDAVRGARVDTADDVLDELHEEAVGARGEGLVGVLVFRNDDVLAGHNVLEYITLLFVVVFNRTVDNGRGVVVGGGVQGVGVVQAQRRRLLHSFRDLCGTTCDLDADAELC
eukprot:PhM_4_TR3462/c0_g2_i8/m.60222